MLEGAKCARAKCTGALAAAAALTITLSLPTEARANPRPLPFTYPYETLPEGSTEVEIYADTTPLRVLADPTDPAKGRLWEPFYRLQTEFEYGITDRWELGLYQVFEANPQDGGTNTMTFDGMKARIRTRLAEAGEWPVDVALYFEVSDMHDELEFEQKVILQRRFGRARVMSNLWVEEEIDRPFDSEAQGQKFAFFINPTLGVTYEVAPRVQVGAEGWLRGRVDKSTGERNDALHAFIGPTFHYNMGRAWLSVGLYAHANDVSKPLPGEIYGPWWFRSVLGVDL